MSQGVLDIFIEPRKKRLKILSQNEIDRLYGLPCFSDEEREQYFTLSLPEQAVLGELHTTKSKITFILQLGYFKARHIFFIFKNMDVTTDTSHITKRYFPDTFWADCTVTKITRLKHQGLILGLCRYRMHNDKDHLEEKACKFAMVSGKPIYIFRQILEFLQTEQIVSPAYSTMQDIIGKALQDEQDRMTRILKEHLKSSDTEALDFLLEDVSEVSRMTAIKHHPKGFNAMEIKDEIQRGKDMKELYLLSRQILPVLAISSESIKYYASLVGYYSVYRLKRFDPWVAYIYLICFIHHRYQRHYDNLLVSFIFHIRKFSDAAKLFARENAYRHRVEVNENLYKAAEILQIFTTDTMPEDTPFHEVQDKAFSILKREKLDDVASHITSKSYFDEKAFQWDHIDSMGLQFKRYLRPVLSALNFKGTPAQSNLMEGLDFLTKAFAKGRPLGQYPSHKIPTDCLPEKMEKYLYETDKDGEKQLVPDRYEFYLCRLLRERLEAGDIHCRDSIRFRSFEDDLIDEKNWKQNKDALIVQSGLSILQQPVAEHLATLERELEERISTVNQRIANGENAYVKTKNKHGKESWSLTYPVNKDDSNHSVFDALKQIDIGNVMDFVNGQCHFMDAFTHILGRYVKTGADEKSLAACLLAWGTNIGLGRMGQISDIGYDTLAKTSYDFIRLETLREANDQVTNAIAKLEIFRQYHIGDKIHSSSDGQKFETALPTINARYSPKYFGLKKGIVSYTLVANHIPVNARIIGANEHESHYVFDILFNNTSEIQPEIHSTDTHGANEVNFAILHMFGYQFAPRYKDISGKVTSALYGFQKSAEYEGLLKPAHQVKKKLIIDNWELIQRIMVSLALKTTTQSIITGKLSAYARKNKTRSALEEYDNIIRSLYLLSFVDDPVLRQNVQLALNRGESYHKLRKAVAYARFGKLKFKTEDEQQVWQECSRLITNCIIFYNATILSNLLNHRKNMDDLEGMVQLKKVSLVAWQHINLHGRYQFTKSQDNIDMQAIIQEIIKKTDQGKMEA